MDAKYSFKNLDAYKEAKNLVKMVYGLIEKFPKVETYALCDQLRRAVISKPSNIAEGSGRTSSKDQAHFFEIAFSSLLEVHCQMDIAYDLEYISQSELLKLEEQIHKIAALLSGLRKKCLSFTH